MAGVCFVNERHLKFCFSKSKINSYTDKVRRRRYNLMASSSPTNCSWCNSRDEHEDSDEEFCNSCEFCKANICCICWDKDDTCYFPGEGYCPACRTRLHNCPACVAYMKGLMSEPDAPMCEKHKSFWNRNTF